MGAERQIMCGWLAFRGIGLGGHLRVAGSCTICSSMAHAGVAFHMCDASTFI
jgi:hypothetical protein